MKRHHEFSMHMMLLPCVVFILVFAYGPMAGIILAFQQYNPGKGLFGPQKWVGLDNFLYIFTLPDFGQVLLNTVFIAILKIIAGLTVPVTVAILLNEVSKSWLKRSIQSMIYLPNFISWVILAGIFIEMLSPSEGIINIILKSFGIKPVFFLADNNWFVPVMVITDTWKGFGFATIIYMASICGIDPGQYESALIDGAGRWKQTLHVTLPGMKSIIVLICILSLGGILNAGFDQIFNLLNPLVYKTGMIIDVLIYNTGIASTQYSIATAMGFFRSVVSMVFIGASWFLAFKTSNYRVF